MKRKRAKFDYNAIKANGRRKAPATKVMAEDDMLKVRDRRKLTGTIADQRRNLSLVAWMIRKHIDYVTDFSPLIRTGNKDLDKKLYALFQWHGRKENFDIARRHTRKRALRLWEMHRLIDGDCLAVLLKTGQLQFIEGDRINASSSVDDPNNQIPEGANDNGLIMDSYGAVEGFVVCNRASSRLEFSHIIDYRNCIFDGYFGRFDQSRGISPLTTAVTAVQDLYEGWDFTLLKIKLHALFGIVIKQQLDEEDTGLNEAGDAIDNSDIGDNEFDEALTEGTANVAEDEVNFADGPALMRLELGEDVDTVESKTPNSGFLEFSEMMIRVILLALDIPYTFYDSMKSSFSARIIDRTEYEEACERKREDIVSFLNQYTAWKLTAWSRMPEVRQLIKDSGIELLELYTMVEWIPRGQPWYDPKKQIEAELLAVSGGIQSRQRIARKYGTGDWWKIVEELEEEQRELEARGVTIQTASPGASTTNEDDDGNDDTTETDDEPVSETADE